MNYEQLALELIKKMQLLKKSGHEKNMQDGISGEAFILGYIQEKQGMAVPGEIGSKMGVSGPRVATALASLESKGLITREVDLDDRRRVIVKLTQEGIEVEAQQRSKYISRITKFLTMLGEKDAREYIRLTDRIIGFMSEIND